MSRWMVYRLPDGPWATWGPRESSNWEWATWRTWRDAFDYADSMARSAR